jgi:hypothetical protein
MALQGTIKDFALPDIFQLIGLQKKTGILTLVNGEDTVTLKFLTGEVVGADSPTRTLEDRLGEVLVRTGKITQTQLQEALKAQSSTLQRLGHLLVNAAYISEDELVEALRIQSTQIIYRLFRWMDGEYSFDAVEDLEYDQRHFVPISAETILMEGARMIDEWPIIERRIKSPAMVLRMTDAAKGLDLGESDDDDNVFEDDLDFDLGFGVDQQVMDPEEPETTTDDEIKLSSEERQILALVDGRRSVGDICDLLAQGEFDTYRMLADLFTRHLVEEAPRAKTQATESGRPSIIGRMAIHLAHGLLAVAVIATVATLESNPLAPWKLLAAQPATNEFRHYASLTRLEKIAGAIQVFYLDAGNLPKSLSVLAQTGYLAAEDLIDPWGRAYHFQLSAGGYQVVGLNSEGQPDAALTVSRRLTPAQRLMLAGEDVGG